MKALVLSDLNQPPKLTEVPDPVRQDGDVQVRLSHAALNRRDVWIMKGQYPKIVTPIILGSDGVGTLVDSTECMQSGNRVVLYPGKHWGDREQVQSDAYEILGMPSQGTFAERICVAQNSVYLAPEHLSNAEAAALPLAGLTAWRAVFSRGALQEHERVLVTGMGGGVASIAAQFANAAGAEVYGTSSTTEKLAHAKRIGCVDGVLYNNANYEKQLRSYAGKGFDLIVDGAGGDGVGTLLKTLAPGGRFVFYGGTCGKWPTILPQRLFYRQVSLLASTMGSPRDFEHMLSFVRQHQIRPVVDRVFSMTNGPQAFQHLHSGTQMGKVVINLEET